MAPESKEVSKMNDSQNGQVAFAMDCDLVPRKDISQPGYRSFELAATAVANAQGTSGTFYALEPVEWIRTAMEAAKKAMVFQPLMRQEIMKAGNSQHVIPKQKLQILNASWTTSIAEYTTADTDIVPTTQDNFDGVTFEPEVYHWAIFLTN